jgi:hypothetical protein
VLQERGSWSETGGRDVASGKFAVLGHAPKASRRESNKEIAMNNKGLLTILILSSLAFTAASGQQALGTLTPPPPVVQEPVTAPGIGTVTLGSGAAPSQELNANGPGLGQGAPGTGAPAGVGSNAGQSTSAGLSVVGVPLPSTSSNAVGQLSTQGSLTAPVAGTGPTLGVVTVVGGGQPSLTTAPAATQSSPVLSTVSFDALARHATAFPGTPPNVLDGIASRVKTAGYDTATARFQVVVETFGGIAGSSLGNETLYFYDQQGTFLSSRAVRVDSLAP